MNRKLAIFAAAAGLLASGAALAHQASPADPAHSGNLVHFFTEPDHLLLMLGSVAVAVYAIRRLRRAKARIGRD